MANKPLILSHNYYDSTVLFPTHAPRNPDNDDVAGSEFWRVSDNLRDVTHWTPSTTNAQRALDVNCGIAKSADTVIVDRGHNLAGVSCQVQTSPDGVTWSGAGSAFTIPSAAGGLPTDANGCLTPDGVFWKTLGGGPYTAQWFRFTMAPRAGIAQIVAGLYLGLAYRFAEYYDAPGAYDYRRNIRHGKNVVSKGAVRVKREVQVFGEVDIRVRLEETDFQNLRPHVDRLLLNTHPWWFCLDDSTTEGAGLMRFFQLPGDTVYDPVCNPVTREVSLLLEEVIPSLVL